VGRSEGSGNGGMKISETEVEMGGCKNRRTSEAGINRDLERIDKEEMGYVGGGSGGGGRWIGRWMRRARDCPRRAKAIGEAPSRRRRRRRRSRWPGARRRGF
jgi:hypothetical protein